MRLARGIGLIAAMALLQSCEPCAGVLACTESDAARVSGRIVSFPSGHPVGGVWVAIEAGGSIVAAATGSDGFWYATINASGVDRNALDATVTVTSPAMGTSYVIPHVRIPISRQRGDGVDIGRYYDRPYLRFIGEARARSGQSLAGATLRAERVGGVGGRVQTDAVPIESNGRFRVEGTADAHGVMLVKMTITGPGLSRTIVYDAAGPMTIVRDTSAAVQGTYSIGAAFLYVVRLIRRGDDAGVPGASVSFTRTGGVPWAHSPVSATTDANGYASPPVVPLSGGNVIGTLRFSAPGLPDVVIAGFTLPTVDDDQARFGGNFSTGFQVASVVSLYQRTSYRPLSGVDWSFAPTSGPVATVVHGTTNTLGYAGIRAPASGPGTVRGDLTVRYLPPRAPEVLRNITIHSAADDSVRLAAYLGIGPSLLWAGTLVDDATSVGIAGARVEFRRVGGVQVTDSLYAWTTNEIGLFRVAPAPLEDGDVLGTVTIRPPAPYRDTTFLFTIPTFVGDETRPGPTFRLRRP